MSDWIKMSDRLPTPADMPIYRLNESGAKVRLVHDAAYSENAAGWWMSAQLPALPAPEPTLEDIDQSAFVKMYGEHPGYPAGSIGSTVRERDWQTNKSVWFAALAYRDSQNREDVKNIIQWEYTTAPNKFQENHHASLVHLRRRCGL